MDTDCIAEMITGNPRLYAYNELCGHSSEIESEDHGGLSPSHKCRSQVWNRGSRPHFFRPIMDRHRSG